MMGMGWMMMRAEEVGMITEASKGKEENYCFGENQDRNNDIQSQPVLMASFLMIFISDVLCAQLHPGVSSSHLSLLSHRMSTNPLALTFFLSLKTPPSQPRPAGFRLQIHLRPHNLRPPHHLPSAKPRTTANEPVPKSAGEMTLALRK